MFVLGFPGGSDGKESVCSVGDLGSISGLGRFPGEGNGYPLKYSCLEKRVGHNWATNTFTFMFCYKFTIAKLYVALKIIHTSLIGLLMCENAIDFIYWPFIQQFSSIVLFAFALVVCLKSFLMSSNITRKYCFISSSPFYMLLIFSSLLTHLARVSGAVLNRSIDCGYLYPIPIFKRNAPTSYHSGWLL